MLLNASGFTVINSLRIPPHDASIIIESQTLSTSIPLQGVSLKIDAMPGPVTYDPFYDAIIPSLKKEMDGVEELSPPDFTLVNGETPWPTIAAYFDVESGAFSACNDKGAADALLTIETGPGPVQLIATPFQNSPNRVLTGVLDLGDTATITVQNSSAMEMDDRLSRRHFELHYLLAQFPPTTPQVPRFIDDSKLCGPESGLFNAGCSDTNYP
ncbi:MAG TPA: hypothetical protein VJZ76_25390 [Thermoanaerobaculia bacterium]|nr:hypothetical protein [Thermoanaerobaculia bacterium]